MKDWDIKAVGEFIHQQNKEMGWWDKPREMGTLLMLVVSEVAEAMEGDRKSLKDDHLPQYDMVAVELADAVIRILDIAEHEGYNLAEIIEAKVAYNRNRADHQLSARQESNGKKY